MYYDRGVVKYSCGCGYRIVVLRWCWYGLLASFPGSLKARAEEEKRRAWYQPCTSITQILAKPYSVRAVINNNCAKSAVDVLSAAVMAGSSDTFSSALSYAMELLGTPNLTLNEEQRKYPRGGIPRKFCVRMGTDRIWQEHLLPSSPIRDRVQARERGSSLCYC